MGRFSVLKIIMENARKDKIINYNPLSDLKQLSPKRDEVIVAYSKEQIKLIMAKVPNEYKELIMLLCLTGTRISEALGLTPEDVKTSPGGILYIDVKKQWSATQKKYVPLKSLSREIPIIPEIKELLKNEYKSYQVSCKIVRSAALEITDNVSTFHSFRHFFISEAKSKNVPEKKVEYLAGHTLPGIEKTYTHFTADSCTEILEYQKELYPLLRSWF